jgi:pimeloyl-ACP methyl ester carboxylesterase
VLALGSAFAAALDRIGLRLGMDLEEMGRGVASLSDRGARQAFVHTMRAVLDPGGQRVSATDRLYLTSMMPSLVMWGDRDPLIPVHHAEIAHRAMPGSRLEIFDDVGHFPQLQDPMLFATTLADFIDTTEAATFDFTDDDLDMFRDRLLKRGDGRRPRARRRRAAAGSGSSGPRRRVSSG